MRDSPYRLSRLTQIKNCWHLRRAAWSRAPNGLLSAPEPWTIGNYDRGKQLVEGNFLIKGQVMEVGDGSIWNQSMPSDLFEAKLHGFGWLDDIAAVGDSEARNRAQTWLLEWVSKFGMGKGLGWNPDLTGRRLTCWINHSIFIKNALPKNSVDLFHHSLALQTVFLSRRWQQVSTGVARLEALCGLVCAGYSLVGMDHLGATSLKILETECVAQITSDGTLLSRNPEELLKVFGLLIQIKITLNLAEVQIPEPVLNRISKMVPILRSLRHGDGTLARFHGGSSGSEYFLDQTLAASEVRPSIPQENAMGFARFTSGSTTVIVDAAAPNSGPDSFNAHASTCAFELSTGRTPLIVSCGSGSSFGDNFHLAGRCTASHSTMTIEGVNSSWFSKGAQRHLSYLQDVPKIVKVQKTRAIDGVRLRINHNGYQGSHGLMHVRTLDLPVDGSGLIGEDELYPPNKKDVKQFDKMREQYSGELKYAIQFHIHPDVHTSLATGGSAVLLTFRNGDFWVLRHDGSSILSIEESVYFDDKLLRPRTTSQIVLSGKIKEFTTRVGWSLAKSVEKTQEAIQ